MLRAWFLILGMAACLGAASVAWAQAAADVELQSPLRQEYEERLKQIDPENANARFDLGLWLFDQYKGVRDLEPLELAIGEMRTAARWFSVRMPDGKEILFHAADTESSAWSQIAEAYGDPLKQALRQVVLDKIKTKTEKEGVLKNPDLLNVTERREVLFMASKRGLVPGVPLAPHADRQLNLLLDIQKKAEAARNPDLWAMAFMVIGGLGIFLLGMKHMSEGMQAIAGTRLRRMISEVTDNRFASVGAGTAVTCLVQSSSITTVIVVGFVNGGLMLLHQAVGVIMGANIGTTITGWILVLKIGRYGWPMLGLAAIVYRLSRSDRWRYPSMAVLGLGMVFVGLEMMKDGFKPMEGLPAFEQTFALLDASTYFGVLKCAAVGCLLTFMVQSSSATLGITIGLASTGIIPYETAAALVFGENIGTTITAWLASIGATTNAKRAAYFHVLFNVIGVIWITAVFDAYIKGVGGVIGSGMGVNPIGASYRDAPDKLYYAQVVTAAIAATHSGFNIANTLLFLPFVRVATRMLEWLIPDPQIQATPHLTRLDIRLVESPVIGIEQARGEVLKMADSSFKMMEWTRELLCQKKPDERMIQKVLHREKIMDNMQHEIVEFMTDLLSGQVPHAVAEEGRELLRALDEYESISDYVSTVLKSHLRLVHAKIEMDEADLQALLKLHDAVGQYCQMITEAFQHRQKDVVAKAETRSQAITRQFKDLRELHLHRLSREKVDPVYSMSYNAMLTAYRKIKEHALNIAQGLAGQK